jgi:menaquinol-cytochrome c reductase iron-sulfur subunit
MIVNVLVLDVHYFSPFGRDHKDRRLERMSKDQGVSRRQFLNYCLTGVGGFLAAGMLAPMIKFAVDPALKKGEAAGNMVPVANEADITAEPQNIPFTAKTKDAWLGEQETGYTAWVYKEGGQIIAISPICKHLGCTVGWKNDPQKQNRFFCPCHNGLYEKNGLNVPGTPPMKPLDTYQVEVKDGKVLIGKVEPNKIVGGA